MPFQLSPFMSCDVNLDSVLLLCDERQWKLIPVPKPPQNQSVCQFLAKKYAKTTNYETMKKSSRQNKGPFSFSKATTRHSLFCIHVSLT